VQRYLDQRVPVPVMSRLLRMDVRLEGSLQKLAGGWRVNVRLVDVHTGKVIWAETLDRAGGADAAIQKEVAAAIAEKVRTHLRLR
jgi:TolB-like protein